MEDFFQSKNLLLKKVVEPIICRFFSDPSSSNDLLGKYNLAISCGFYLQPINTGPNQGYSYISSIDKQPGENDYFAYTILPSLNNSLSEFYQHQCGSPSSYPTGAQLKNYVENHEKGSGDSHYKNYSDSLNDNTDINKFNRDFYCSPNMSVSTCLIWFTQEVQNRINVILNSAAIHPCGNNKIVLDDGCNPFQINYAPNYLPCSN